MTGGWDRIADPGAGRSGLTRVTVVAHEVGPHGGMERQLAELCTRLLARDYRLTVIARRCDLAPHPHLRWIRVRAPKRPFALAFPLFFVLGSLAVSRWRDGLLHTMGAIVFNRADVTTVQFCHLGYRAAAGRPQTSRETLGYRVNAAVAAWMSRAAERFCYRPRRVRRLVAVSGGVARELELFFPVAPGDIAIIPNGVEAREFAPDPAQRRAVRDELGLEADDLVALFVGGDWQRKGLRFAIEGVARATAWRLVVVGAGDEASYRDLASRHGARERVLFVGRTATPARYFASADAFVLPTLYEAFSLVTLEAAATGLPLLVSRANGAEELIGDGVNGWLVERDGAAIAVRLEQLGADPALRAAMGDAARSSGESFGWDTVVESSLELYGTLVRT